MVKAQNNNAESQCCNIEKFNLAHNDSPEKIYFFTKYYFYYTRGYVKNQVLFQKIDRFLLFKKITLVIIGRKKYNMNWKKKGRKRMNPSYFRIQLPKEKAIERLYKWDHCMPKEIIKTDSSHSVQVSLGSNGQWKGICLYVYEKRGWTVFEDLSGGYMAIPAETWKEFAEKDNLVVAGYNDAICFAELVVIIDGAIKKEFLEDMDNPEENVNYGELPEKIDSWIDVADFVDKDTLVYSEKGDVYIF